MRNFWAILFIVCLTVVHGLIVIGVTLSLPLVLIYPSTRAFYLPGIGLLLVSWMLFSDCPLTTIERKARDYFRWPQLNDDFISHHVSALTGLKISQRAHRFAERAYLVLVIAIIIAR